MKNLRIEALIIAAGIIVLGIFFRLAVADFIGKDRIVTVKGLAEMEVKADKVIWPLMFKEIGNSPTEMYSRIEEKNKEIVQFLTKNGIKPEEISINPPDVSDRKANLYNNEEASERYIASSTIIVTSSNVDGVRQLMARQSELMKRGIALVAGDYNSASLSYEFTRLNDIKPQMIEDATKKARTTAEKFAKDSESRLGKIKTASQGQFSIEDRDEHTSHIKKVRVVTTVEYYLKD